MIYEYRYQHHYELSSPTHALLLFTASSSDHVFRHMLDALEPAQQLILAQSGTLTTLVMTVVARLATPVKRDRPVEETQTPPVATAGPSPAAAPSLGSGNDDRHFRWAAMTVNVGDSASFVFRSLEGEVEELTGAAHAGTYRDPR